MWSRVRVLFSPQTYSLLVLFVCFFLAVRFRRLPFEGVLCLSFEDNFAAHDEDRVSTLQMMARSRRLASTWRSLVAVAVLLRLAAGQVRPLESSTAALDTKESLYF